MMRPLFLFATGTIFVLCLLEVIFHLLPVSTSTRTGYYIHPHILTYPARHCFTISAGWDLQNPHKHCANNFGFIANRDFVYNPGAIAIIGDSFVEANMLPVSEGLAAQVEVKLRENAVYAMGGPGSNLLDYAERARFANTKFGIKKFVFIINRTDVRESICGSGNIHAHCIEAATLQPKIEVLSPPGNLKQLFRELALAQYLISQLRLNLSQLSLAPLQPLTHAGSSGGMSKPSAAASEVAIRSFFSRLPIGEGLKYFFVIDPDRSHLFDYVKDPYEIVYLKTQADLFGVTEIDPINKFKEFTISRGMALEVSPHDKHWNSEAIKMVAIVITDGLVSGEN